ncbi:MAG TPA: UDP-N-acetylmuramate dehydrogenase [Actinomycetota bacterium]
MAEPLAAAEAILLGRAHGPVTRGGAMAPLTSYRIGGPAGLLFEPSAGADLDALAEAVASTALPVLIVGRGSNMLVSDRGFPGIAVRLGAGFRWARVEGSALLSGAAMPLPALSSLAMRGSLAGLEFAVAIPASLGGAVRMNAGAHGREMRDVVERVTVFDVGRSASEEVEASAVGFAYRETALPAGAIVTAARLGLRSGEHDAIVAGMNEAKEWRRRTQPLNLPNGGSVFRNPGVEAAGSIIERVCGKGMRVGGARISEVHANFIVTEPGARADHVYSLMRRIQRMVAEDTGIDLQPELKLMGEFEEVDG